VKRGEDWRKTTEEICHLWLRRAIYDRRIDDERSQDEETSLLKLDFRELAKDKIDQNSILPMLLKT